MQQALKLARAPEARPQQTFFRGTFPLARANSEEGVTGEMVVQSVLMMPQQKGGWLL